MNGAISIRTEQFRFNKIHFFILIAIALSIFIVTNYLTVKQVVEKTNDLSYEDIESIAEEIYGAGEIADALENLPLDAALIKKMSEEIERILAKTTDYPGCEVYYLRANQNNNYPILGYGDALLGYEYLRYQEVWKVGITCNGQHGRYPTDIYYKSKNGSIFLSNKQLRYEPIHFGTYKQVLILEKILIYTYPFWSGHDLVKPPGCKIFR